MESACWVRKPSKCWGHHDEHCYCRLRNFTFELFDAAPLSENAVPKLALNLSQPSQVTFPREGQFTIRCNDTSSPVLHCEKSDLKGWVNMLSVFNGREKPWSPIPMPLICHAAMMACIKYIQLRGMKEEGVFRLPGSHQGIETLYLNLITERVTSLDGLNIHDVCGCLKKLMRGLPETVLTNRLYAVVTDKKSSPEEVAQSVKALPSTNNEVLTALFALMKEICASPATKMNKEALGVCMTPCWSRKDTSLVEHMTLSFEPLFQYFNMGSELEGIRQAMERTLLPVDGARFGTLPLPPKKKKLSTVSSFDATTALLSSSSATSSANSSPTSSPSTFIESSDAPGSSIPMNTLSDLSTSTSTTFTTNTVTTNSSVLPNNATSSTIKTASHTSTPSIEATASTRLSVTNRSSASPPPPPLISSGPLDILLALNDLTSSPTGPQATAATALDSSEDIASFFSAPVSAASTRPGGRSSSAPPPPTLPPSLNLAKLSPPAADRSSSPPPPPLRLTSLSNAQPGSTTGPVTLTRNTSGSSPSFPSVARTSSPPPPPVSSAPEVTGTAQRSISPTRSGVLESKAERPSSPTRAPGSPILTARPTSSSISGLRPRAESASKKDTIVRASSPSR